MNCGFGGAAVNGRDHRRMFLGINGARASPA
jgi:hypothetical protein